ncbi:enoyl-CoA hydratase/isomerase family protein [Streptomyces chartreusis]|uniref:Enoyl-CoA hydratase/isomerase family protein n=1 Tax=Streptomyces chartreusis TaxID=1969 RepID=A0A7I0NSK8_STRCX|nr:enoyl-CoA hydratase/isomerase family protein [Streptomyces chartreusis]QKZ16051.1 enoyl-CoA hydratase/isomerase family protein [Streptomyces chartreusis]
MTDLVRYACEEGVARIVLSRPDRANAVDLPTANALGAAVDRAAQPNVRAVVVLGEGRRFCAGGDVAAMAAAPDRSAYVGELAATLDEVFQRLARLSKPVVAGVRGAVAGAGVALMLSCDVIVSAASTKFLLAYADVGLTPDCGVSYLLPRAIGQQRALELALTGRVLTAEEGREWGLVTEVVDDVSVEARTVLLGERLAAGPAHALGETRRLLRSWQMTREQAGREEVRVIAEAMGRAEAKALVEAFVSQGSKGTKRTSQADLPGALPRQSGPGARR